MVDPWDPLIKVGRRVVVDGQIGTVSAIRYKPHQVYVWFDGATWPVSVPPDEIKSV